MPFFLCWGSFLNVLAYRLVRGTSVIFPASHCPFCNTSIPWYDLIPVISWLALNGKCRKCHHTISFLYPFIELLTVLLMSLMVLRIPATFYGAYFIFFSALIVTIRSDIETMLISRFASLFLIPVGVLCALLGYLPITGMESLVGAGFGYGSLRLISWLFYRLTKREGMGEGDMELLGCIGAFLGVFGVWITIMIASFTGSVYSIGYLLLNRQKQSVRFPFGPFLAFGALSYALYHHELLSFFLGI